MDDMRISEEPPQHWLLAQPAATQKAIRLAFFAFFAVLFAWSKFLFGAPDGSGIEADFSMLLSGLVAGISLVVGTGLAIYQLLIQKQALGALISLLSGLVPLLALYLVLQYLTLVKGLVLV